MAADLQGRMHKESGISSQVPCCLFEEVEYLALYRHDTILVLCRSVSLLWLFQETIQGLLCGQRGQSA